MSIRSAASCCQPLQESSVPRGARTVRGPLLGATLVMDRSYGRRAKDQGSGWLKTITTGCGTSPRRTSPTKRTSPS